MVLCCPECGSKLLYRDGIRYLADGSQTQRWLCRNCGYRFSERQNSNSLSDNYGNGKKAVKLSESRAESPKTAIVLSEKGLEKAAMALGDAQQDVKGLIVSFMWTLKKEGLAEKTIENYAKFLKALVKKGANLHDPESVKEVVAMQETWGNRAKALAIASYSKFALVNEIKWKPPKIKVSQKLPWIPLESEIDSLIACCGKKISTILQLLKETGMRIGEALALTWTTIDFERNTITLNETEKNGKPRVFKCSAKLIAMLNNLPKKSERIFGNRLLSGIEGTFSLQRKRAAAKLQNPRLLRITFHTLRHWKATMEYHKTKDILHVKELLGHRNINNTLIYTQLVNFESDEYHSATAKTVQEAKQLIEAGFEYVCDMENLKLFRKRK
jgi:integrase/DNA-directed RNA polymerase subunit M/transcription elongation factor TFIIS